MKRRVVVTGLGAVTPIGNTVDVFWDEIKKETVGIGPITQFDVSDYKVKIAAQVKGFDARERLDFKSAKRMELFTQYAAAAAKEAFEDAGIDMEKEDPYRAGVIVGSGVGSLKCVEDNYETILKKGPNRVHPLMVPLMISNMAAGNISIRLGLRGKCTNVATACASGSHCIGDAFRAIQYGDADIMVAGGAESAISPTGLAGFTALTALSTSEDPTCASRPFDKDRDGFVLGEGAGIIVLEELEHAKARGAKIYAETLLEKQRDGELHLDRVYTSPQLRAAETARFSAEALGIDCIRLWDLREMDLGDWEGRNWDEIRETEAERHAGIVYTRRCVKDADQKYKRKNLENKNTRGVNMRKSWKWALCLGVVSLLLLGGCGKEKT